MGVNVQPHDNLNISDLYSISILYSSFRSGSLSNLSSSLSEHLHNLVRAFSSRTERVKASTVIPPSPSDTPEYDANSDALSGIFNLLNFYIKYLRPRESCLAGQGC